MKHLDITIKGRVQRVGFRFYAMQTAYKLGVKGLVKNQEDGSVFIEAEGDETAVADFLKWCKKGPLGARVKEVSFTEGNYVGHTSFEISSRASWQNTNSDSR